MRQSKVQTEGVSKRYGDLLALDKTDLSIAPGEFVSIVGPSGCGKSTLLEIVGGLNTASSGQVLIDGEVVTGPTPQTSIIFQEASTLPWRTVIDNVAFPLEVRGAPKTERLERAKDLLRVVGLQGFERHYPAQLSGGMRQRVAIARTLAVDPKVILADEPFGALDEQTRLVLALELLSVVKSTMASVLFVTHSIQEAVLLSDRVLVMSRRPGRVLHEVAVDLGSPRTEELIGSERASRLADEIWQPLKAEAIATLNQEREVFT